jgi:type II secretory pathway component PulM
MARPVSPVIPGLERDEVICAKDQPEYGQLPSLQYADGTVLTRWRLTWRERLLVLLRGDVYLSVLTFNRGLQPVLIEIERPQQEAS